MKNLKLYEEWFWKEKLTDIEKVQNEPVITIGEIDKNIKLFDQYRNKVNFYLDVFRAHTEKEYYLNKCFENFHRAIELFYKLSKVSELLPEGFLKKTLESSAKFFSATIITDKQIDKRYLEIFFNICFYLNRINKNCFNGGNGRFYYIKEARPHTYLYKFKDKEQEQERINKHKDIDPLGEEDWGDN